MTAISLTHPSHEPYAKWLWAQLPNPFFSPSPYLHSKCQFQVSLVQTSDISLSQNTVKMKVALLIQNAPLLMTSKDYPNLVAK